MDSSFVVEPTYRIVATTFAIKIGIECELVLEDRQRYLAFAWFDIYQIFLSVFWKELCFKMLRNQVGLK